MNWKLVIGYTFFGGWMLAFISVLIQKVIA